MQSETKIKRRTSGHSIAGIWMLWCAAVLMVLAVVASAHEEAQQETNAPSSSAVPNPEAKWIVSQDGADVVVKPASPELQQLLGSFEFKDVSRHLTDEKYKNMKNPPIFVSPLGACEVPNLSLKRVKLELRKRLASCDSCTTKQEFQATLRDLITANKPVMSDDDVTRFDAWVADVALQPAAGAASPQDGASAEL